jgi:hypothetical protein
MKFGNVTWEREEQPEKHEDYRYVMEFGRIIWERESNQEDIKFQMCNGV